MINEVPNLDYIKQFSGGEKSFEEKLISVIKIEFPLEIEIYFENLKSNNFKLASENVHKLKHKISILGLENSCKTANDYENSLIKGNTTLKDEFQSILNTITNFLESYR